MKNLLVACSPRHGNTDALAARAAQILDDSEIIRLRDYDFSPCDGCGVCERADACKFRDAATTLYEKLLSARRVWFFAPVYFCGFDAHTKAFLDRGQYLWTRRKKQDIEYRLIAVGGQRTEDNFDGMVVTLKSHALTVGARYVGGLFFRGVDAVGDVSEEHLSELIRYARPCD